MDPTPQISPFQRGQRGIIRCLPPTPAACSSARRHPCFRSSRRVGRSCAVVWYGAVSGCEFGFSRFPPKRGDLGDQGSEASALNAQFPLHPPIRSFRCEHWEGGGFLPQNRFFLSPTTPRGGGKAGMEGRDNPGSLVRLLPSWTRSLVPGPWVGLSGREAKGK